MSFPCSYWNIILLWSWCKQTSVKLQILQLFIIYVIWSLFFRTEAYIFRLFLQPSGARKAKGADNILTNRHQCSNREIGADKGQTLQPSLNLLKQHSFMLLFLKAQLGHKKNNRSLRCSANICPTAKINRIIIFCFLRLMDNVADTQY